LLPEEARIYSEGLVFDLPSEERVAVEIEADE
jgi:hypothetical protein